MESCDPRLAQVIEAVSRLKILQHDHVTHLALQTMTWNNAVHESPLFAPFLHHLQVLEINNSLNQGQVLNALSSLHELRELNLSLVDVPPIVCGIDLPLVHTLQRLSLLKSALAWMDGLVFTQLQTFTVDEHGWPEIFKRKVGMPACTHIAFKQDKLESLPVLQSDFHLPLLDTFELSVAWDHHSESGISALQRIHAKRFKFRIYLGYLGLLELLESKDEVEQLDLVFLNGFTTAQLILRKFCMTNHVTGRVPCPNTKVLRLQFYDVKGAIREHVSQVCREMMNDRRLAGYSLETCYIWWQYEEWKKAASLVLVMENVEVRTEV